MRNADGVACVVRYALRGAHYASRCTLYVLALWLVACGGSGERGAAVEQAGKATATVAAVDTATPAVVAEAASPRPVGREGAALVQVLREGGHVIVFRHAATDFGQIDADGPALQNCAVQRNLSEAGRADARAIGGALAALGIPVGPVLASPYCRTRETAELAFGRVEVAGDLLSDAMRRGAVLRDLVGKQPPAGENTVLITHQGNLIDAMGPDLQTMVEGEAVVVRPLANGEFRLVARLKPDDWRRLAGSR